MTTTQAFDKFFGNIKIDNSKKISNCYREITKKLNKTFRDTESETVFRLNHMDVIWVSRAFLTLICCMSCPQTNGMIKKIIPQKLLRKVKDALMNRYPTTKFCRADLMLYYIEKGCEMTSNASSG